MRRLFTLLSVAAAAMVTITSCQQEDFTGSQSGEVEIAIKTSLPTAIGTYTSAQGGSTNVDQAANDLRYIMEVWTKGANPEKVHREVKTVDTWADASAVTFNARLLAKEYDFVFWADFVAQGSEDDVNYITTDLNNVQFNASYGVSKETRDAYYGKQTIDLTAQGATIGGIVLKRPFGKIRLIATDKPVNTTGTVVPTLATVNYGSNAFYGAFDALNGAVKGNKTAFSNAFESTPVLEGDDYVLAFDYLLAAEDLTSVSGVSVAITVNGETYNKTLPTLPIAVNKLTTVTGNFYSNEGTLTVDVSDAFDANGNDVQVPNHVVVSSIEAVNDILINDAINAPGQPITITVKEFVGNDTPITIPNEVTADTTPSITLNLSAGVESSKKITIGDGDNATAFTGTINVTVPAESAGNLEIKAPNAHVVINGTYTDVTASTSGTTLVVEADCTVNKLIVASGNVEIFGTVTSFGEVAEGSKIFWAANDAASLKAVLAKTTNNDGVILTADIDLGTTTDQALITLNRAGYIFDGRGYALSGSAKQNIIVVSANDVAVNNVTITNTTKAGITVYCVTGVSLDGVTFLNNKGTGLIVNGSTVTASNIKAIGTKGMGSINLGMGSGVKTTPHLTLTGTNDIQKGLAYQIYADFAGDKSDRLVATGWTLKGDPTTGTVCWTTDEVVPTLSRTWTVDRTEPKEFTVYNGAITMTTNTTPTTGFYSWCGKQTKVFNSPNNNWNIEMTYMKGAADEVNKEVGLWGVVHADNSQSLNYPILAYYKEGSEEGWKYWKALAESDNWVKIPNVAVLDGANKMRISYEGGAMKFYVNDVCVATDTTYTDKTATVAALIVNQKNAEQEYTSVVTVPTVTLNK